MDNNSRHTVLRWYLLYITAYMQGMLGMSRNKRTNNLTYLPMIPVAETNVCFFIMNPRASDIVDLDN